MKLKLLSFMIIIIIIIMDDICGLEEETFMTLVTRDKVEFKFNLKYVNKLEFLKNLYECDKQAEKYNISISSEHFKRIYEFIERSTMNVATCSTFKQIAPNPGMSFDGFLKDHKVDQLYPFEYDFLLSLDLPELTKEMWDELHYLVNNDMCEDYSNYSKQLLHLISCVSRVDKLLTDCEYLGYTDLIHAYAFSLAYAVRCVRYFDPISKTDVTDFSGLNYKELFAAKRYADVIIYIAKKYEDRADSNTTKD
jgi:hypothetical protein